MLKIKWQKYILLMKNVGHIKIDLINRYVRRTNEFISEFENDPLIYYGKRNHILHFMFISRKEKEILQIARSHHDLSSLSSIKRSKDDHLFPKKNTQRNHQA